MLRAVREADRGLIERGFAGLGAQSRYQRFMFPKQGLSDSDLRHLTRVDGGFHFALGVVGWDADARELPLALARFVRASPDSEVAEAAVAVVDALQGRGLGRVLLQRLAREAAQRGVRRFVGDVLAENAGARCLLRGLDPEVRLVSHGTGSLRFELTLPRPEHFRPWAGTLPA
ncbi:MAG TPA: GNAT family N-acetyltransferase [Polyangiales bacterium]|nr:GNAT family N-acetyltransferase [Polyangiales bacterium]